LEPAEFLRLVWLVRPRYEHCYLQVRCAHGVRSRFEPVPEVLLMTLIYYRSYVSMMMLSHLFGCDASTICRRRLQMFRPILAQVSDLRRTPQLSVEETTALIVDCTEQRVRRPLKEGQRSWYSGKKKCHTIKSEVVVDAVTEKAVMVSEPHPGAKHDLAVRRESPPLREVTVMGDSGYQGLQAEHPDVLLPVKRQRGELSEEAREYNRTLSQTRVAVEHAIGRIKTFRIIGDRYRGPLAAYAAIFGTAAMLVNLKGGFI
jgi:hypothetical protein